MIDYQYYCKSEEHDECGCLCKKTNAACVAMYAKDRKKCQMACPVFKPYPVYKLKKLFKGREPEGTQTLNDIIKEHLKTTT